MRIITAALPYANGFIHLGHVASTFLPADIYARFNRLKYGKNNTVFISATDEHGTPIEVKAMKYSLPPEKFVEIFRKEQFVDLQKLDISLDIFYFTHSSLNEMLVHEFFKKAQEKGLIYKKEVEALKCEKCERFLPDRFVKGTCPFCGAEMQYGDVCEVCGRTYHALDLVNPMCILCGNTPKRKKTVHYFFALSKLKEDIERYLTESSLQEDAKNYALSWIKDGLKDVDITRDIPYFGFIIPGEKDKYFYVWVDAPFGYVASSIAYDKTLKKEWKNKDTHIVHFMGKDIIYFHYIYWIGMLITMDYTLPKAMPVRGYLTLNKKKMSKSRGNFIYLRDLLEFFDSDHVRYYFARSIPDSIDDGDFSFESFRDKVNKELVGIIANLGYRILKISEKINGYMLQDKIDLSEYTIFKEVDSLLETYKIKSALDKILSFAVSLNEKFNAYEPWKGDKKKIDILFKDICVLFALLEPYLPNTVKKFYESAGIERRSYTIIEPTAQKKKPQLLVRKIEERMFDLASGKDKFSLLELRVGRVEKIEHKKSERIVVYFIDIHDKKIKIVENMPENTNSYTEYISNIEGKKVVVLVNINPTKIKGYTSEGMLVRIEGHFLGVEDPLILPGSEVIIRGVLRRSFENIDTHLAEDILNKLSLDNNVVKYKGYPLIARSDVKEVLVRVERG